MKRFAFVAATGLLALALTACGEQSNKQPAAGTTTDTTTTTPQPAQTQPAGGTQNQTPNQ
ncbi:MULTISPECIES: hypothetical protein [Legionella]|uniref:Uncharacterized protein n=1 Tax=Legionella resiliens TaxID=2905958 RepID=A0ABS8X1E2_9GAMM|nr:MULTISPECIES: hypothetical protein [unclassified Legionella]MCE0723401.1 hypothetical protein [Legionella sp. 9fVS26]MCE3532555.1 hypothetical protein [Legionella sp. 8cVS16]QLZ68687.1 hypothetical protein FOLKNPGA_01466 [Legionella sp. PC1000]